MINKPGIYVIKSFTSERCYVGSAVDMRGRKNKHLSDLRKNRHHSIKLQRHFNKYGEADLFFDVLENINDVVLLKNVEQFFIDTINPYFNNYPTASSCLGCKHSEESKLRRKSLKNALGHKMTNEQKENCRKGQLKMHEENPHLREIARVRATGNRNKRGKKLSEKQVLGMTGSSHYAYYDLPEDKKMEVIKKYGPVKLNKKEHRLYSSRSLAKEYGVSRNKIMQIVNNFKLTA